MRSALWEVNLLEYALVELAISGLHRLITHPVVVLAFDRVTPLSSASSTSINETHKQYIIFDTIFGYVLLDHQENVNI